MPQVKCTDCPLRSRKLFIPMTEDEVSFMLKFKAGELNVERGTTILMEGSNSPQLFTVMKGMGVRYKTLENGRRQVINFVFPGDFLGLQAGVMGEMQHSAEATTSMCLCVFNRADIWQLFKNHPARAYDLTWIAAVEEHFLGETLSSLGQRDASGRVSWAMLRIYQRLDALGLAKNGTTKLPFRQQDLADALGLSLVHTNKTLAKLKDQGLLNWSDGNLTLMDQRGLAQAAMIDLDQQLSRPLM